MTIVYSILFFKQIELYSVTELVPGINITIKVASLLLSQECLDI